MTTESPAVSSEAVLHEVLSGLSRAQKTLSPWLLYDERGSQLFEQITALPEYYLTRTERSLFAAHAQRLVTALDAPITVAELGAGSAAKTGLLLRAAAALQPVLYQPIDISPSALEEAAASLASLPRVTVAPQVANYITDTFTITRPPGHRVLALYIGSSIGNFSPAEARGILRNLRSHLQPGDALLLGVDLAPSTHRKSIATLLAAYDDAAGVTAAFNLNLLARLNRELGADFHLPRFAHRVRWNAPCSRIEMHLESLVPQTVTLAGATFPFAAGETLHTENSYKFTPGAALELAAAAGFSATPTLQLQDPEEKYLVLLTPAI